MLRGIVELWTEQQRTDLARTGVSLSRLSELFELGNRMTLQLVFDLWRRDYVTLDMYGAEVAPTPLVLDAYAEGHQDELVGAEFTLETVDVWLDRVSGHLTGRSGYGHPPDRDLTVPAHPMFAATADDITGSDLVRAVREQLADRVRESETSDPPDRPRGRNLRVLEARLLPSGKLARSKRTLWFPVDITVRQDPESEVLRVSVAQDSHRSLTHCERIGRLLTEFLERRPDHRFSRKLKASLRPGCPIRRPLNAPSPGWRPSPARLSPRRRAPAARFTRASSRRCAPPAHRSAHATTARQRSSWCGRTRTTGRPSCR